MLVPDDVYDAMLRAGCSPNALALMLYGYRHGQPDGEGGIVLRMQRVALARASGLSRGALMRAAAELEGAGFAQPPLDEDQPALLLPLPAPLDTDAEPSKTFHQPVQIAALARARARASSHHHDHHDDNHHHDRQHNHPTTAATTTTPPPEAGRETGKEKSGKVGDGRPDGTPPRRTWSVLDEDTPRWKAARALLSEHRVTNPTELLREHGPERVLAALAWMESPSQRSLVKPAGYLVWLLRQYDDIPLPEDWPNADGD